MDKQPTFDETDEQRQLKAELIARFGEVTFNQAVEMSGLRYCLQALACDELTKDERMVAYHMAGMHLAKLHASLISFEQSKAMTDCAKRLDAAVDTWLMDDIEAREGLPPPTRLN